MVVLGKMGARVSGQDISAESISECRQVLQRHSVEGTVQVGDATRLLFEDASFDAVFSGDFIEHISLEQKRLFLAEVFRVLRPGGVFVVKTPNLSYLRLSVFIKRLTVVLKGRSPLRIHIPHTRDNPDSEHHGLINFSLLRKLLLEQLFHAPTFQRQVLSRPGLPVPLQEALPQLPFFWRVFNEHLILTAHKPLFYGYFP